LSALLDALNENLNVELGQVVECIEYDCEGVAVTSSDGEEKTVYHADACLCTIPLGVLKRSAQNKDKAPRFDPALPQWKVDAINSMGFGLVNKVVLVFEKPFWENVSLFGYIPETVDKANRGEMFRFHALADKPVLIGLVSGEAAFALEAVPDEVTTAKAMSFLFNIFGPACPPKPLDVHITRWNMDNFTYGAFSFVPPGCDAGTYETLAKPLKDSNGCERIFFAGEHTN
uniref:Amino_oxidase domain-containing protein n=1 Tax=Gongylonema pulchrum TaxID=637853 RepID=A0A183CWB7_9BILA